MPPRHVAIAIASYEVHASEITVTVGSFIKESQVTSLHCPNLSFQAREASAMLGRLGLLRAPLRSLCAAPGVVRAIATPARIATCPHVPQAQPLAGLRGAALLLRAPTLARRLLCSKAATAAPNPLVEWAQWGVVLGSFYVADNLLKKAFASAGISFPAPLAGMFGILGGLWGLSLAGAGGLAAADGIVALAGPALRWITRYLPLFYAPALIVLPLAVGSLSSEEMGKIASIVATGMPITLFASGAIVLTIRRLANVSLLPVAAVPPLPPFTPLHFAAAVAAFVGGAAVLSQAAPGSDEAWASQQLLLLASTVGGLISGSIPPAAIAAFTPHPVLCTVLGATLGALAVAQIGGGASSSYTDALKTFLTKGKGGAPQGAGDLLMSFLGVVVLSFGFHIYGQRALLARHALEVVGGVALASLLSMVMTAAAGRALSLSPELALALAPRSVTVALAMPIAQQLSVPEETIPICAAAVVFTGLTGAVFCQRLLNIAGFTDPLVRGIATASSCHGLGTAALAATEPQALPFCALGYGLAGICASCWVAVPPVREFLLSVAGKS